MTIKITTTVQNTPQSVYDGFDEKLFVSLAPPFPITKLLRFDGCDINDEVHIKLDFLAFNQEWHALITDNKTDHNGNRYFIDKGVRLPFFLKKWQHTHHIRHATQGNATLIIDDITYQTPLVLLDYLMYPVMYLQFWQRKSIYKKIFNIK